jgi:O-antigen ligase
MSVETAHGRSTAGASGAAALPSALSIAVVVASLLAAAPAYPAWGVFASTDMPMVFTGLALVVLALGLLKARRVVLPRDRVVVGLLLGLLVWGVASAASSEFAPFAFFGSWRNRLGLLTLVPVGLLLVLARGLSAELGRTLKAAAPWVFGAWTLAVLVQAVPAPFDVSVSAWGLSSNGAISAQLMVLLFPALLTTGRRNRALRGMLGLAVALVMWRIGSTIGLALVLGWTAVDALLTTGRFRMLPRRALVALPAAHLLVTAGLVAVGTTAEWAASALEGRQRFWRLALDMIASSPLAGTGPDTMAHASAALVGPDTAQTLLDTAVLSVSSHSAWLDIATCFGIVGAALALGALTALAARWSPRIDSPGFLWIAGLALYAVTLLVQPVVLQILPVLALVMAASLPPAERACCAERTPGPTVVVTIVASALAVLLVAFGLTCVVVGRADFRPASLATTERAARFWRFDPALWAETGYRYGATGAIDGVERSLQAAIDLVPGEYSFRFDLAAASDAFQLPSQVVVERYDAALAAYPLAPDVHFARGLHLAKQRDTQAARETYALLRSTYPEWSGTADFRMSCAQLGIMVE